MKFETSIFLQKCQKHFFYLKDLFQKQSDLFRGNCFPGYALKSSLQKWCPNTEFFLVRIFPHSEWIRRVLRISPYSVWMRENTDQRKVSIWSYLTRCIGNSNNFSARKRLSVTCNFICRSNLNNNVLLSNSWTPAKITLIIYSWQAKRTLNTKSFPAWKVSVLGDFLVRIFPYLDWIRIFTL